MELGRNLIRSIIGSRWHQQQIVTWTVLSGTRGSGKRMCHWESHPGWWSVIIGRWSERMRDHRLDKRLEAEGVALWGTDRSSGWAMIDRVFVLRAVKLETKGDSQRESCIRALRGRVSEKREVMCFVVSCTRVA